MWWSKGKRHTTRRWFQSSGTKRTRTLTLTSYSVPLYHNILQIWIIYQFNICNVPQEKRVCSRRLTSNFSYILYLTFDVNVLKCTLFHLECHKKLFDSNISHCIFSLLLLLYLSCLDLYVVFYLCVMACYAMIAVPYNSLIADQTPPLQRGLT